MTRALRLVLAVALAAVAAPAAPSSAACRHYYPVEEERVASHGCDGLHPGAFFTVPSKKWGTAGCTAGFFFTDRYGNRYTSVPGTCHLDFTCLEDVVVRMLPTPVRRVAEGVLPCVLMGESEEEPVYGRNAPVVKDWATGRRVGVIVYAVNKQGVDFALIRIDRGVKVSPTVPLYGGPTALVAPSGSVEEAFAYTSYHGSMHPNAYDGLLDSSSGSMYHEPYAVNPGTPGAPVVRPDGGGLGYYRFYDSEAAGAHVLPYGPALARMSGRLRLSLRLMPGKAV